MVTCTQLLSGTQSFGLEVLGSSGGVVNSFDFHLGLLQSLGHFYFWCIRSSQWKAVTVNYKVYSANFKGIFEGLQSECLWSLITSNNLLLVLQKSPRGIYSMNSWSSGPPKNDQKIRWHFLSILHHLSHVIFANTTVATSALLLNSRLNFHCYIQRKLVPTQKLAWKWQLGPFVTSSTKGYEGHWIAQSSFTELVR